jgi:hypothetical protein
MAAVSARWRIVLAILGVLLVVALTSRWWLAGIGRSLVCTEDVVARSDAILIENFEPYYILFERAAALEKAGLASMTFVPVETMPDGPNPVSTGFVAVMARQARLRSWDVVPIRFTEPISLNAAVQLRTRLTAERINSLIVIAPGFRSRRSALVYRTVLGAAGMKIHCVPVFGRTSPETWTRTWHGIQDVIEEFFKLQYYRFYVLPFVATRGTGT